MSRTGLDNARQLTLSAAHFQQPSTILRLRLRLALALGTVVVLVARTGVGKTFFMNRLLPGKVINNAGLSTSREAAIPVDEIPAGSFAIDEPARHSRDDLARALLSRSGCVLSFQAREGLYRCRLAELLEHRRVLVLEVV